MTFSICYLICSSRFISLLVLLFVLFTSEFTVLVISNGPAPVFLLSWFVVLVNSVLPNLDFIVFVFVFVVLELDSVGFTDWLSNTELEGLPLLLTPF